MGHSGKVSTNAEFEMLDAGTLNNARPLTSPLNPTLTLLACRFLATQDHAIQTLTTPQLRHFLMY